MPEGWNEAIQASETCRVRAVYAPIHASVHAVESQSFAMPGGHTATFWTTSLTIWS